MTWRTAAVWVAAFAMLVLLGRRYIDVAPRTRGHAAAPRSAARALARREATVLRTVDGDTILVRDAAGPVERVRYIGVDTPESVKPNTPVQCFGHAASAFNARLVAGRTVTLVPDSEPRDKYGRSLAYVYLGRLFVNAELLRRGYARTLEIAPNTRHAAYFASLERVAIRTNRGLWAACDR